MRVAVGGPPARVRGCTGAWVCGTGLLCLLLSLSGCLSSKKCVEPAQPILLQHHGCRQQPPELRDSAQEDQDLAGNDSFPFQSQFMRTHFPEVRFEPIAYFEPFEL